MNNAAVSSCTYSWWPQTSIDPQMSAILCVLECVWPVIIAIYLLVLAPLRFQEVWRRSNRNHSRSGLAELSSYIAMFALYNCTRWWQHGAVFVWFLISAVVAHIYCLRSKQDRYALQDRILRDMPPEGIERSNVRIYAG
jgi:hypothetical protein